jgi:pyruvate/2-oxoglutarate dehydrogenase complex dihydrolipoamide acyltransferase (E2) component
MKNSFRINQLEKISSYTAYRKIALGTWKDAYDPSTYCMVELEVTEARKFLNEFNKTSRTHVKVVHLLAQAFSLAVTLQPDINSLLRGSKLYRRKSVDAFHQVVVLSEGKDRLKFPDLSGISIKGTEELGIEERVERFNQLVKDTRKGQTEAVQVQRNLIPKLPNFIMASFLKLSSFLIYGVNIKLPFLGITEDPFGSYMFSDTSSIRAPNAFIPLVPYSRCGLLISTGKVYKKPLVENDQVVIREVLPVSITFDHRLVEGIQMAEIYRVIKMAFEDPAKYLVKAPVEVAKEAQK